MGLPTKITAGDSATWTKSAADAAEIVTYSFRDSDGKGINVRGVNDATDHTFTISQGESAQLHAGWYDVSEITEDGAGGRDTDRNYARCRVYPDPQVEPGETSNARMLAELEALQLRRAKTGMIENKSVGGFSTGVMTNAELDDLIVRVRNRVLNEKRAGRVDRGVGGGGTIGITF